MGAILNLREQELIHGYPYIIPADLEAVILIHGSSTVFLERILVEGLLPRSRTGHNPWRGWAKPSNPDYIYYGSFNKAHEAASQCVYKYGGHKLYLQVRLCPAYLFPDEDVYWAKDWRTSLEQGSCATTEIVTTFLNVYTPHNSRFTLKTPSIVFI